MLNSEDIRVINKVSKTCVVELTSSILDMKLLTSDPASPEFRKGLNDMIVYGQFLTDIAQASKKLM